VTTSTPNQVSPSASHTPGPWRVVLVESASDKRTARWFVNAKTLVLAETKVLPPMLTEQAEANARLIAAAPDLLAACKLTIEENLYLADGDVCTLIHLKRAIAKAEGR